MSRWLRGWAPVLAWAALIFFVSSRPTLPVPLGGGTDKIAHFGAYSVLGIALGHARVATGISLPVAAVAGIVYGLVDELHQSTVPGRAAEVGDWVADSLGVIAGLLAHHLWRRARSGRSASGSRLPESSIE